MISPRYSCIFVSRACPRACSYCTSKDVRGDGSLLSPQQWNEALHILEGHGVKFHLILGNELFSYPDPVGLVRALNDFHGRYGIYSTFPPGWSNKYFDECIDAGLYNITGGVDVWPGLLTGDKHIDRKSQVVLSNLEHALARGVPDVRVTITIHRQNYDKLAPLLDLCTEKGIWAACSLVEASADGKHDFYGPVEKMKDWLIPEDERERFRDCMYEFADQIASGRWLIQVPPSYFREMGDREVARDPWHCSLPVLIHLEEDGTLRACSYRGGLGQKFSVFDLAPGGKLPMSKYVELMQVKTGECPGCGVGGGAWSYHWQAEMWVRGQVEMGDQIFQTKVPGYEFEEAMKS